MEIDLRYGDYKPSNQLAAKTKALCQTKRFRYLGSIEGPAPLSRRSLTELIRKTSNASDNSSKANLVIEGEPRDGKDYDLEHRLLMPDGSVKYLHVVAHPLRAGAGERAFVGAVMDVTAAKRAEEAVQEAQAALAHVTRMTTLRRGEGTHQKQDLLSPAARLPRVGQREARSLPERWPAVPARGEDTLERSKAIDSSHGVAMPAAQTAPS